MAAIAFRAAMSLGKGRARAAASVEPKMSSKPYSIAVPTMKAAMSWGFRPVSVLQWWLTCIFPSEARDGSHDRFSNVGIGNFEASQKL